ncbi:MAG: glycosyltransferase family 2 protein [Magnetococcales bacterium]|nr:glycosyltransferase family 2 protein [Magnetococcales bacterium]
MSEPLYTLSIVIPAYNEEAFIGPLLQRILAVDTEAMGFRKEIIVVDDGSRDATAARAEAFPGVRVVRQKNQGKGAAVQRGVRETSGDYVLVQDADLEYFPEDYLPLLRALDTRKPTSVYGSRPKGVIRDRGWCWPTPGRHLRQSPGPWVMNILLSLWCGLLFGRWLSDLLTAYKIYPAGVLKGFTVRTRGFETDHELTAKLIRSGVAIVEVPIAYEPRSVEEGKKIRPRDGLIALWTFWRFRFRD